jgi:acyl-CoA reductase-like NAD-dependent aldehyde dehydrogenase
LLAGNSVILKPSPQTPTTAEQIHQIFTEAGLPDGVLQYFHCGSYSQIETLVRSPQIQLVCFTGSVAGGLAVQTAASERVAMRVGLELGGKDPAYIRSDVDIPWAAEEIVDGAVFNSGQSCCSVERVYVDEKIYDEFVSAVQEVLKGYKLGDPFNTKTHVGPVVSKRSAETIRSHIQDALDKGARNATPENESFQSPPSDGNYVAPTLLTNVNHDMLVMTEETFGPVIPIMKVKSDQEAIKLMNDSIYGLTASIWTKDVAKGHELVEDVEAGTVFVNRCDYPSPVRYTTSSCPHDLMLAGPCVDRMERLGQRPNPQQVGFRPIRKAQKLPHQRLSKIEYWDERSDGSTKNRGETNCFSFLASFKYVGPAP